MYLTEPLESNVERSLMKRLLLILTKTFEIFIGASKATQVASSAVFIDLKYHEPMFAVMNCVPECTLFQRGDYISGIQQSTTDRSWFILERTDKLTDHFVSLIFCQR